MGFEWRFVIERDCVDRWRCNWFIVIVGRWKERIEGKSGENKRKKWNGRYWNGREWFEWRKNDKVMKNMEKSYKRILLLGIGFILCGILVV